jgi:hypothetical protein
MPGSHRRGAVATAIAPRGCDLRVYMGMAVDKAGRDDQAVDFDDPLVGARVEQPAGGFAMRLTEVHAQ